MECLGTYGCVWFSSSLVCWRIIWENQKKEKEDKPGSGHCQAALKTKPHHMTQDESPGNLNEAILNRNWCVWRPGGNSLVASLEVYATNKFAWWQYVVYSVQKSQVAKLHVKAWPSGSSRKRPFLAITGVFKEPGATPGSSFTKFYVRADGKPPLLVVRHTLAFRGASRWITMVAMVRVSRGHHGHHGRGHLLLLFLCCQSLSHHLSA